MTVSPAGERVFAGGEVEEAGQFLHREHVLAIDGLDGERAPSFTREHGIGRRPLRRRERIRKDAEARCQGNAGDISREVRQQELILAVPVCNRPAFAPSRELR